MSLVVIDTDVASTRLRRRVSDALADALAGRVPAVSFVTVCEHTRPRHIGAISTLVAASDGRSLVSAGSDRTIRVWDTTADDADRPSRPEQVTTLSRATNGSWFATADADLVIRLWDPATGTVLRALDPPDGAAWPYLVALDPTTAQRVRGSYRSQRRLDPVTGRHLRRSYRSQQRQRRVVATSPGADWLASIGRFGEVLLWDADTGTVRHSLTGHSEFVWTLAAAPDGSWLASRRYPRTTADLGPGHGRPA